MSKELDSDLLSDILRAPGISGNESAIAELLIDIVSPFATSIERDAMGNLIVFKKGSNRTRLMLSAHMDEIGLLVRNIDSSGFIRLLPVGGIDPKTLVCQEFIILSEEPIRAIIGSKPIHLTRGEDKKNELIKVEDCILDTGLTKDELEKRGVSVGTPVVRVGELRRLGPLLSSKSMDNRICVFILTELIRQLKRVLYDTYFVFCTQEEVGLRGIRTAAASICPNIGINLDVGLANDLPGVPEHEIGIKLGKGTAIKLIDATSISHRGLFSRMQEIAKKNKISFQVDACNRGGTDACGMQYLVGGNCIVSGISIPLRYMHSPVETVHENDVTDTIKLMKSTITDPSLESLLD
ncbi:M42 family metallopeptidase [Candidatus Similichlamydia epinepheli]|uniref:M42 family metallopeptidase n=1 Tax=Candidatus Similichlamydia epinepheli TaxID=1903953 RepID=UPI001300B17D|nr:M20/M25/M40 family metallo-hydrolase [Candidatus Similichlamydia epinepheli]